MAALAAEGDRALREGSDVRMMAGVPPAILLREAERRLRPRGWGAARWIGRGLRAR